MLLAVLAGFAGIASAHDWPQLLGPQRNGVYSSKDLAAEWPKEGPRVVWQRKIGHGFAGPAVAEGRLVLFHRIGDEEIVEALDAKDGTPLWKHAYPTAYRDAFNFDPGPRAVPTLADGKVFTFGAEGMLTCLSLADGRKIWERDCKAVYDAPKGFFGMACSPLVEDDYVLVNVGGKKGCVVRFDADTGQTLSTFGSGEASYSSPVNASFGGLKCNVVLTRDDFIVASPRSNSVLGALPFRPPIHASVTGATPVVIGDEVFISAAYGLGAVLLRVDAKGAESARSAKVAAPADAQNQPLLDHEALPRERFQVVWSGDDSLSLQYSTPVYRDGFLYGLHGRHDFPGGTELRCVEWKTGKVRWGRPGLNGANILRAGDQLLVLCEDGQLIRAAASPDAFKETGRAQILGAGARAYPALARGLFYARDKAKLVCLDLRAK